MNHLGDRLAAYVDGELPRVTRELISAHLLMCSSCRAAVEAESRTKSGLTHLSTPDPSPNLMGALLDLAAPGEPLPPRRRPLGAEPAPRPVPVGKPVRVAFLGVAEPAIPYATRGSRVRRSLLAAGAMGVAAVSLASAHAQNAGDAAPPGGSSFAQVVGPQSAGSGSESPDAPGTVSSPHLFPAPSVVPQVEGPPGVDVFYGHTHTAR
ncbi:anti-sigma factor family protein [Sporichthya polymorpha]|uniref:anti-sigma factor family protein n=1 Tax=Sporichthya polymorpha TaxID=35751 RepID=UPI00039C1056|nr:zf-HC2 domain-containing protein [Sporichthya polymorpha]